MLNDQFNSLGNGLLMGLIHVTSRLSHYLLQNQAKMTSRGQDIRSGLELREEVSAKKVKMEKLETTYFKQIVVSYIKLRFSFGQRVGYCNH